MDTRFFENSETAFALNAIGENIFICDMKLDIVWINDYAKELINKLSKYIHVNNPNDLIGMNISKFHKQAGEKQKNILKHGNFPHEVKINLFNKYVASIIINPFKVEGLTKGFILTWKDVTDYEKEMKENTKKLEEMYTPILDTVLDNAYLLPIIGALDYDRIEKMTEITLNKIAERGADYIVVDLTGITRILDEDLVVHLNTFTTSLQLMGAEVIYAGFPVELVKQMVNARIGVSVKTVRSFSQAMYFIWKKEGYELKKIK